VSAWNSDLRNAVAARCTGVSDDTVAGGIGSSRQGHYAVIVSVASTTDAASGDLLIANTTIAAIAALTTSCTTGTGTGARQQCWRRNQIELDGGVHRRHKHAVAHPRAQVRVWIDITRVLAAVHQDAAH
jgi:hypothetical protein